MYSNESPLRPGLELPSRALTDTIHIENTNPPGAHTMNMYIQRARRSAPGPDGIPYAAWGASPQGIDTLSLLAAHIRAGAFRPNPSTRPGSSSLPKPLPISWATFPGTRMRTGR